MKLKTFLNNFLLLGLAIYVLSCNETNDKSPRFLQESKVSKKITGLAFYNQNTQTFTYKLRNDDSIVFYIPKNPWLIYSYDTIYVEAVHKKKKGDNVDIMYNQFNPPELKKFLPNMIINKELSYKGFKAPNFISIRVYNAPYPYNPEKDYSKYHSLGNFLVFENTNSFLVTFKINNSLK